MSFPDVDTGFETFFEPTRIWLFGKRFDSLIYNPASMGRQGARAGEFNCSYVAPQPDTVLPIPPKRIERTLRRDVQLQVDGTVVDEQEHPQFFARIYSFTYEAHYYRLPRPLLFLMSSAGEPVGGGQPEPEGGDGQVQGGEPSTESDPQGRHESANPQEVRRHARRRRFSAKFTGVEARDWNFSNDILVWAVDRKDLTVCLDVEIGNYQEILLDSMLVRDRREDDRATRSRGDLIGRGGGSFRGDMIGPHQNK